SEILGTRYEQIFDFIKFDREKYPNVHTLLAGDFVSTEDGSGVVHMAPAFGQDDFDMAKLHNLPVVNPVSPGGKFLEGIGEFTGRPVKTFTYQDGHSEEGVDKDVVIALKKSGKIYKSTNDYVHSYPHCWRTDNPVIYFARESWFINSPSYKDRMVVHNNTINWQPPEIGSGRFGNWLADVKEWSLSRDRYWGTPLPIWVREDGQEKFAVGSIAELKEGLYEKEDGTRVPVAEMADEFDVHRPFVDKIVFEKGGHTYRRTPEIIDVWFDSGAMPFAQFHYPFENKDLFEKSFPADFICEGVDQTRGWFYTLHNIATVLFDKPAFKNIIVNDLILDKNGQKMSKSKGNVVQPFEIIDQYGVDPLRWYFATVNNPWIPKRFDEKGIQEVYKKFFDTLLNTYNFFAMYANIDGFDPQSEAPAVERRPEMDRWILSRLYTIVGVVNTEMDRYDITDAARPMVEFLLDDVSNWYVRLNRRRFWKSEDSADKQAAYHTLYEVLMSVVKLMAPIAPFVADGIYQNLRSDVMAESVHLTDYPVLDEARQSHQDAALEAKMAAAQLVVRMARSLREETRIKVRQPLPEILVYSPDKGQIDNILLMKSIIREELNVKDVTARESLAGLVEREVKANFKVLGPRFGKRMKSVAAAIQNLDEAGISTLEKAGKISVEPEDGGPAEEILISEVELRDRGIGELAVTRRHALVVGLVTAISPELAQEGLAREFINRIQNLRKESGLDITDRIRIFYGGPADLMAAVNTLDGYIRGETLAMEIRAELPAGLAVSEVQIEEMAVRIGIEKAG
ncbi:MAG: isoleucine--tRNA ligase, partial [Calditrichaeota bacterium]|nr:isoleucine--tRNA ligase [Calditrichota bacterium]